MTKIKIDGELISDVMRIWHNFSMKLVKDHKELIEGENIPRVAGYLTIAYMFGAEREDEDGPKCEVCKHTPRCRLFGPPPDKCDWCGAKLVVNAKVEEVKVVEE